MCVVRLARVYACVWLHSSHDRHAFRPLTTRPPSYLRTFHPSSSSALFTAGPRTPMPLAECVPRPVMIFSGFA